MGDRMQREHLRRREFIALIGGAVIAWPLAFLAACLLATGSAAAQTYPSRPITLLAPPPPRGPDGYSVLLHQVALAAAMTLYPNLAFDAEKDFVTIGPVNTAATTIAARPTLPPNTMTELVRWMKEPGQNAKVAHAGAGSFGHLCGVLFAQEVGAKVDQIPYRGAGPALNDLMAGHADLSCQSAAAAGPLIKAGKLKAYGILAKTRFDGLPDL